MKRRKRLLALALAGVLAGQMGMVAWGTGTPTTTPTDCEAKGHGSLQRVTAACTEKCTHWLESDSAAIPSQMTGGTGDNYYFVKPGDIVNCTTGNNYIVVDLSVFAKVSEQGRGFTVVNFKAGQKYKIYVLGTSKIDGIKGTGPYEVIANGQTIKITSTGSNALIDGNEISPLEKNLSIKGFENFNSSMAKGTKQTVTAVPENNVGEVSYTWERYTNNSKTKDADFTNNTAACEIVIPDNDSVGTTYRYKCIARDEMGFSATAETTVTVSGCDKTGTLSDITKIETNYQVEQGTIRNITLPDIFSITGGNCTVHGKAPDYTDDPTHGGYAIKWDVQPADRGASIESNNTLKLDGNILTEGGEDFSLIATVYKGNQPTNVTKSFPFHAKKVIPEVCDAKVTLDSITVPTPGGLLTGEDSTINCISNFKVEAPNCTVPEHQGDDNHGYQLVWNFTPDSGDSIPGVGFANGVFTIEKGKLPNTTMGGTLTATAVKGARTANAGGVLATAHVDFRAAAVAACPAIPESVTLTLNNSVLTDTKWNITDEGKKTLTPYIVQQKWNDNSCNISGHTPNAHIPVKWSIDKPTDGITINNTTGEITATTTLISNVETLITIRATIENANESATHTAPLTIIRPKRCNQKITGIDGFTGDSNITIEQGSSTIKEYNLNGAKLTYDEGTCEFGDNHNDGLHNETVTWTIQSKTNESSMIDKDNAFKVETIDGRTGRLTVRGDKLREGNSYEVTLLAKVSSGVEREVGPIHISCTVPDDDDDSDHWESYEDKIEDAKRGSTVKMDLTGNGEVPFYVFESARGRDVTLQMKAGKNYTWTINGKAMKKWPAGQIYLPLEVETLKDKTLTRLCRDNDVRTFKLRHEGSFYGDMKLTVDVGVGNAKKTMYLYSYNEDKERLTYQSCALADNDGDVTFVMTRSLGAYAVTSKALYGEKPVSGGGGLVNGSGSGPTTVYPPVAPSVPSSSQSPSSSSSSSSGSESSSQSEPALPPEPPASSREPAAPTDTDTKPKDSIPVLVPVLILAIAGVITATVLVVRSSRGRLDDFDD